MNYVYDCGSVGDKSQCRSEIAEYASVNKSNRVDMAFLSHFDLDHVNCVPDLAQALPIQRFIIPLVHPAERLRTLVEALDSPEPPGADDWYIDLIVDPVAALQALSPEADIIEIEPGTEEEWPAIFELPDYSADEPEEASAWGPPGPGGTSAIRLFAIEGEVEV